MVNSCCVNNCKNRENRHKDINLPFHTFPVNRVIRRKWIVTLNLGDSFVPSRYHKVCGQHFSTDDYDRTYPMRMLKKTAVPTIFDYLSTSIKCEQEEEENVQEDEEAEEEDVVDTYLKVKQELGIKEEPLDIKPEVTSLNETNQSSEENRDENPNILNVNIFKLRQKMADSLNGSLTKPQATAFEKFNKNRESLALYTQGRKRIPIFIGDFREEDFESPQYARLMWNIAKKLIARKNKQLKLLRIQNKRLSLRVSYLKEAYARGIKK